MFESHSEQTQLELTTAKPKSPSSNPDHELEYQRVLGRLPVPLSWFKTKPYLHQLKAFEFGLQHPRTALLLSIGSGKSFCAINLLRYRIKQGFVNRVLIVSPISVFSTWEDELEKHSDLDFHVVRGGKATKLKILGEERESPEVIIAGYESVRIYEKEFVKKGFQMCICDECLRADTRLRIKNGERKKIVRFKKGDLVQSYNFENGCVELKKVLNVFRQQRTENLLTLRFRNSSQLRVVHCTCSHKFFGDRGPITAGQLEIGEKIYQSEIDYSKLQQEILVGCLLGDSSISNRGQIAFSHSTKFRDYLNVKHVLFRPFSGKIIISHSSGPFGDCHNCRFYSRVTELAWRWRKELYPKEKKVITEDFLKKGSEISLAFWFLDDGHFSQYESHDPGYCVRKRSEVGFSSQGFTLKENRILQRWLLNRFQIQSTLKKVKLKSGEIRFRIHVLKVSHSRLFFLIRPFVPQCMEYKIPFAGRFIPKEESNFSQMKIELAEKIEDNSSFAKQSKMIYDLEIEDNHNYILENGIIVSNSVKIKSPVAKVSHAFWKVFKKTPFKIIMTGLLTPNTIMDSYSQYKFLAPGIFGTRYKEFKELYGRWGGYHDYVFLGPKNIEDFKRKLYSVGISFRREEMFDLPPKIYEKRTVELSPRERKAYESMKENFLAELSSTEKVVAVNVLTQFLRLHQITSGHLSNGDGEVVEIGNSKLKEFTTFMEDEIIPSGAKVLVFVQFIHTLKMVQAWALKKKLNSAVVYGAVNNKKRGDEIRRFQKDPNCRLFLGQISTVSYGINLTQATVAIFLESNFSYGDRDQCEGRSHRLGQTEKVTIVDFLVPKSIDTYMLSILKRKKKFSELIAMPRQLLEDGKRGLF